MKSVHRLKCEFWRFAEEHFGDEDEPIMRNILEYYIRKALHYGNITKAESEVLRREIR